MIDRSLSPIVATPVSVPECVWQASSVVPGRPDHPMPATTLRSTLHVLRKAKRDRDAALRGVRRWILAGIRLIERVLRAHPKF